MKKLSVIIPVYNERKTILEILKQVQAVKLKKEIIIVDDFSTDGTREILKKINNKDIKIVFHGKNFGKGRAVRTGIKNISGDIVVIQDADLEYNPQDYLNLVKPIVNEEAKAVYGTRFPRGSETPSIWKNRFFLANRILTKTANFLYGADITDEPTCYKMFDSELLKSINLKCTRFEFCPEVTAKVRKRGFEIKEVPISYTPRTTDDGKKIKWRDGFEAVWTLIKYRFVD